MVSLSAFAFNFNVILNSTFPLVSDVDADADLTLDSELGSTIKPGAGTVQSTRPAATRYVSFKTRSARGATGVPCVRQMVSCHTFGKQ
ncbi:hypothetical protein EVAR_66635_1 [Eumeta japonica]|uniref:Uncharacterized protein n=1 Tax=Eumeta variegata TaxID=151549 RepID=A0A4C1ZYQ1_EUMVA|nr:hypothetical protein EVAR_66635_1 [Eumeta japonica]